jgi:GAF domain
MGQRVFDLLNLQNYTFNPYALPPFAIAMVLLFVLFQVFAHRGEAQVHTPMILALLATSIWLLAFSFMYCSKDESVALRWAKLGYLGVPFICAAIYETAVRVRGCYTAQRLSVWASWIISLVFAVLAFDTVLIPHVMKYWWGFYPQYGTVGSVFLGYFGVMAGGSLWHYYRAYEQTAFSPNKRVIKLISFGILVGYLAGVDFIPKLGFSLYPFGYLCVLISSFLIIEGMSAPVQRQGQRSEEKCVRSSGHQRYLSDYVARLRKQQAALLSSLQAAIVPGTTVEAVTRVIAQAGDALDAERIAVWRYEKDASSMQCVSLYRRASYDIGETGSHLFYPPSTYLASLLEGRTIRAESVALDIGMAFVRVSLLDVPLRRHNELLGVLSCLSIGEQRTWHDDEEAFAQLVAKILAFILDIRSESEGAHGHEMASLLEDFIGELIRRDRNMTEIEHDLPHSHL